MLAAMRENVAPETRKGREEPPARPSTNYFIRNNSENSAPVYEAQCPPLVPRIIATHWLRIEAMGAAHG